MFACTLCVCAQYRYVGKLRIALAQAMHRLCCRRLQASDMRPGTGTVYEANYCITIILLSTQEMRDGRLAQSHTGLPNPNIPPVIDRWALVCSGPGPSPSITNPLPKRTSTSRRQEHPVARNTHSVAARPSSRRDNTQVVTQPGPPARNSRHASPAASAPNTKPVTRAQIRGEVLSQ